jgi:predicted unusual protein kinase regulating ubiquinone biosynthesis (AarF/ABC1/UbiB family)
LPFLSGAEKFRKTLLRNSFIIIKDHKETIKRNMKDNTFIINRVHFFNYNKTINLISPLLAGVFEVQKTITELDVTDLTKKRLGLVQQTRLEIKNALHKYMEFSPLLKSYASLIDSNYLNLSTQTIVQTYVASLDTAFKKLERKNLQGYKNVSVYKKVVG